jgi:homoserine dehydrogenase
MAYLRADSKNEGQRPEGKLKLDLTKTHVATGYKGPIVHAFHELRDLAAANNVHFLFEATVMGGAPIFSLSRRGEALPAARLERFRGILNSTTNLILAEMEHGTNRSASRRR